MNYKITDLLDGIFDVNVTSKYEFKEICGFTFAFEKSTIFYREEISSEEIKPVAIIYTENDDYYLAPLEKSVNKNKIIKEYVQNMIN